MSISKLTKLLENNVPDLYGKRSGLLCLTLRIFIREFREELEYYYEEDFGWNIAKDIDDEQHKNSLILCLVDPSDARFSCTKRPTLRRGGKQRRDKIKHRYSYENPLNRIHGFLILENGNNCLTPKEKDIISLSLICSYKEL